jgi:hypothetical protein
VATQLFRALFGARPNSVNVEHRRGKVRGVPQIIALATDIETAMSTNTLDPVLINAEIDNMIDRYGVARVWDRMEKKL